VAWPGFRGGALDGKYNDIADKLETLADVVGLEEVLKGIAVLLRDIGIFGSEVEGLSLAEVGQQLEDKLDYVIPKLDGIASSSQTTEKTVTDGAQPLAHMTAAGSA
jgi:hypothetical protein